MDTLLPLIWIKSTGRLRHIQLLLLTDKERPSLDNPEDFSPGPGPIGNETSLLLAVSLTPSQ